MIIVNKLVNNGIKQSKDREIDLVALKWEDRQRSRQRITTSAGREVGLALPTGSILTPGDILFQNETLEIMVTGQPEPVLVVSAVDQQEFGLICYQVGNLHQPISLQGDQILLPYHRSISLQLGRLGFDFVRDHRVFVPISLTHYQHGH